MDRARDRFCDFVYRGTGRRRLVHALGQSARLCEDVRCEFNGMQTLVGVINVIPTPTLPINYMRLCIWTRWCSGAGKFKQRSRIIGVDEQNVLAQAEVEFELKEMEGHATNVHYFGGVQFQQFG